MLTEVKKIFNLIPDLVFILDRKGDFKRYISQGNIDIIYEPDQFLNKNVADLFPGTISKNFFNCLDLLKPGEIGSFEYQLNQEETKYYEVRLIYIGEDEIMTIVRDISSKYILQSESISYLNTLSSILNELNDVLWSVSLPNYKKIFFSPSTERLYEVPMKQWDDNPQLWLEMIHPDDKEMVTEYINKAIEVGKDY